MPASRLMLALLIWLSLAGAAPAADPPDAEQRRLLTQEYARLYRKYLELKKDGHATEATTRYNEFLAAFRRHRMATRVVSPPPH